MIISSLEIIDELLFRSWLFIRVINDVLDKLRDLFFRAAFALTDDISMVHPLDKYRTVFDYEIFETLLAEQNLLFVKFLTLMNSMSSSL